MAGILRQVRVRTLETSLMKGALQRAPLHPFLIPAYAVAFLLAHNFREVSASVAIRPLVVLELAAGLSLLLVWLAVRQVARAALVVSLLLIVCLTYGHLHDLLASLPAPAVLLSSDKLMMSASLLILAFGTWWILRRLKNTAGISLFANASAVVLIAMAAIPMAAGVHVATAGARLAKERSGAAMSTAILAVESRPDVYYIILDSYARQDVLLEDMAFDNSPFLEALEGMGFFVAGCSRSNYQWTASSLLTSLNMTYNQEFYDDMMRQGLPGETMYSFIANSRVRAALEAIGYKTVAFDSGFEWSRLRDADPYIEVPEDWGFVRRMTEFEIIFAKTTIAEPFLDAYEDGVLSKWVKLPGSGHRYEEHIQRTLYVLQELPRVAEEPSPTFTFAHLIVPHTPFVFEPDGEIRTDPDFYSNPENEPVDEQHYREGYTGQIQFVNTRIKAILQSILKTSGRDVIVVLQGDHGFVGPAAERDRLSILNAYYLPNGYANVYPTISPVNSFRVIFNDYLGGSYEMLPDESYYYFGQELRRVEEASESCRAAAGP